MQKKLKNEKGSISLFVLLSVLFFLVVVSGVSISFTNKENQIDSQLKKIKESYEKDVGNEEQVYDVTIKGRLSDEYQELQYIICTGTQFIDTNYYPNTTRTKIHIGITTKEIASNEGLFGARNNNVSADTSSCNMFIIPRTNSFRLDWASGDANMTVPVTANTYYDIECSRPTTKINETTKTSTKTDSINTMGTFLIGTFNNITTPYSGGFIGYIHFAELYEDGNMIHNYIPAKRKSDNVVGMYDLITRTFLTNAGTGEFTVGPNV